MQKQDILNYLKSHQEYYRNQFGVEFIGIFGLFARDEANENSDIDILYKIEKDKKLSMFNYLKLNKQLEDFFHKKIDNDEMEEIMDDKELVANLVNGLDDLKNGDYTMEQI